MHPRSLTSITVPLLLSLGSQLHAESPTLSGKVVDAAGHPAWGVAVLLASVPGTIQTRTDSNGLWRLGTTLGVHRSAPAPVAARGHLLLQDGHLSIAFDGMRVDGRGRRSSASATSMSPSVASGAARALSNPDTVLLSLDGQILSRIVVTGQSDLGTATVSLEGSFADSRDQTSYGTAWIGTQKWMTRNLEFVANDSWNYETNPDSVARHGRLYTWAAAMALPDSCNRASCLDQIHSPHQGACPTGWHVPTQREWRRTYERAGSKQLMSKGTPLGTMLTPIYVFDDTYHQVPAGFKTDTLVGNDAYGFHGFLSGYRKADGGLAPRDTSLWWTTDHLDTDYENYQTLFTVDPTCARSWMITASPSQSHKATPKTSGLSLRCLAD